MARIRSVHPDICASETLAGLPAELERTFVRLWTHCDDEGRCEDRPRLIKAGIYPEHDAMTWERVDDDLAALQDAGLICRYEVHGKRYLSVTSWNEYQHPQKARPSRFPPPPEPGDYTPTTSPVPTAPVTVRDPSSNGKGLELGDGVGEGEGDRRGSETKSSSTSAALTLVRDGPSPPATSPTPTEIVFDAWRLATGKQRSKLDAKRRRRIQAALAGYPIEDVIAAVRGWRHSPFHCGSNEHHRTYNDLSLLLRDAEHIEQFRDLERMGPVDPPTREPKSFAALRRVTNALEAKT